MQKYKLLLVDDEADVTSVLRKGLEQRGFEVDTFNDPRKALSRFKLNHYQAIILDARMPFMSGFGLAKEIWALEPRARICFLTAFEIYENEASKVFTNFKSHCFVKKPTTSNALAKHIQTHLIASS